MSASDSSVPLLDELSQRPSDEESTTGHAVVRLVIRFVDRPDETLVMSRQTPVQTLKQHLHARLELSPQMHVRLMYRGVLLEEHRRLSDYVPASSVCQVLNCATSPYPLTSVMSPRPSDAREGFDRLRDMGFQEAEIHMLRIQFHEFHRTFTSVELESRSDEARRIEDEWIFSNAREDRFSREPQLSLFHPVSQSALLIRQSMDPDPDHNYLVTDGGWSMPAEGDYLDLVIGLLMGFLFGLIVLPFLYEKRFTLRQQMGIVAGLLVNLIFGIVKFSY